MINLSDKLSFPKLRYFNILITGKLAQQCKCPLYASILVHENYDIKEETFFSGTIDYNDFQNIMTQKMSEKDLKEEIQKAFRLFDDDDTGKISFKNLKRVSKELGENLTDEELQVTYNCKMHVYLCTHNNSTDLNNARKFNGNILACH